MAFAGAAQAPRPAFAAAPPRGERFLNVTLFIAVLASAIAFVEPSPHDGLMIVLALVALLTGLKFDRTLAVPFFLLLAWNIAGAVALFRIAGDSKSTQYAITSFYLALAAMLFACVLAQNTLARVQTLRAAYILSALIAASAGIAGYLRLVPGAYDLFTEFGRALGTFKDPNVFGPFLILPALFVLNDAVSRRVSFTGIFTLGILLLGLMLSFSRGAWFHFAVSAAVTIGLSFLTAPNDRTRMRIFGLSAAGFAVLGLAIVVLLSTDTIGQMFSQRAQLVQSYDVGEGGRFRLQELALSTLLDYPAGMGPFEFGRRFGLQQHNVYLQAFIVYGWAGGLSYFLLIGATLVAGLRSAFIRTPWQPYAVAAFGAFAGEVIEGAIIDTDHWRHFFLILGVVWGLAAASFRARAALRFAPAVAPR